MVLSLDSKSRELLPIADSGSELPTQRRLTPALSGPQVVVPTRNRQSLPSVGSRAMPAASCQRRRIISTTFKLTGAT